MTIPYSDGLKGIEAAIWLGILGGGDAELGLAVLSSVSRRDIDGGFRDHWGGRFPYYCGIIGQPPR